MRRLQAAPACALALIAGTGLAVAQPVTSGTQLGPDRAGCMHELRAFGQAMNQDGYWLSGGQPARSAPAGPWGQVNWPASPDGQLRTLYAAAHLLAAGGDEQTCAAVLDRARQFYASSVADL